MEELWEHSIRLEEAFSNNNNQLALDKLVLSSEAQASRLASEEANQLVLEALEVLDFLLHQAKLALVQPHQEVQVFLESISLVKEVIFLDKSLLHHQLG